MAGRRRPACSGCEGPSRRSSLSPPTSGSASTTCRRRPTSPPSPPPGRGAGWPRARDPGWRFTDPRRPYLRTPIGPAAPTGAQAVERYLPPARNLPRRDMGFLGPGRPRRRLTWIRLRPDRPMQRSGPVRLSFGMPTINGLFATHCSIAPHSSRFITSFTPTSLHCLPEALRRRGYRAEMFNAGDTDWDNSTIWLRRWYDRLWRFPEAQQHDRPVFRAAARRIRRARPDRAGLSSRASSRSAITRRSTRPSPAST